ncbi:baseplate J/gp47 family protein [Rhodoferax sp. TS-BS-61-7]|uniref:baseplate J/gp47 family protein n=1 Tax=Rhodoferax sp. TS-BS-61-7 TaxID=2094194 RepID=UPI000CF73E0F|nr:baseplate J/gp47 family protein [Rhodoferax sp. TS-BS-61-7]PQA78680.1 baseplate J protein [Rhodoferax sp. TS-BS-61-7]
MFNRPTLAALVERIRTDVLSRLVSDDALRRTEAEVYSRALAGAVHGLYGYVEWAAKQIIYDTAEEEHLVRWAGIWKVLRKVAVAANGNVTFSVQVGAVIPAGTLLQALDGVQYVTTTEVTAGSTSAVAPVAAVEPAAAGNRAAGQTLNLVNPVAGVQTLATAGLLSGGADVETIDSLRDRFLTRIQQPPQGGAKHDYENWALEVPGVTRAWVYPQEMAANGVTVRFVRDNDGTGAAIIPSAPEVATVQAYIEDPSRKPVTAALTVVAPNSVPLNFVFTDLVPDTTAVRAAVSAELQDLLRRKAVPGGPLLLSQIRAAISTAAGEENYVLASPSADVTNTLGNMSTMGTITWP